MKIILIECCKCENNLAQLLLLSLHKRPFFKNPPPNVLICDLKETALAGALLQAVWAACPARAVSNVPAPAPPPSVGAGTPQRCHRYHHADCCHRDRDPNHLWSPVIPPGWRVRTMLRGGDSSQHGKPILRWLSGHGSLVPGTLLTGIFLGG